MGPLKDIHLSRLGVLILAVASLAATAVILAGGGASTDAQLAAQAALKHPLRATELVQSLPASVLTPAGGRTRGGTATRSASAVEHRSTAGTPSEKSSSAGAVRTAPSTAASPAPAGSPEATPGTGTTTSTVTATTATDAGLPTVRHVFLLTLDTTNYRTVFARGSKAPYLRYLATRGTVLSGYRTLGAGGLADLLATVSGQPPNADTASGCRRYVPYPQSATLSAAGVARGKGCVYPDAALTLADQVNASGRTWGAYVAGIGQTNCPVPSTGQALDTPLAGTQAGYDVAHNPFAFFGSLLDAGGCAEYDQDLTHLNPALTRPSRTPNLTVIGGDACVDAAPVLARAEATTTTPGAGTTTSTGASADAAVSTTAGAGVETTTAASTGATTSTSGTGTTTNGPSTGTTTNGPSTGTTTNGPSTGTTTNGPSTGVTTSTGGTQTATPSDVPAAAQAPDAYGCPAGQSSGVSAQDAFLKAWVPKILASAAYRAGGVLIIAFSGPNAGARAGARVDTGALVLSRWTLRHKRLSGTFDAYSLLRSIEDMLDLAPLAKAAGAPAFAKLVLSR